MPLTAALAPEKASDLDDDADRLAKDVAEDDDGKEEVRRKEDLVLLRRDVTCIHMSFRSKQAGRGARARRRPLGQKTHASTH
jgi:hypothetical protein